MSPNIQFYVNAATMMFILSISIFLVSLVNVSLIRNKKKRIIIMVSAISFLVLCTLTIEGFNRYLEGFYAKQTAMEIVGKRASSTKNGDVFYLTLKGTTGITDVGVPYYTYLNQPIGSYVKPELSPYEMAKLFGE